MKILHLIEDHQVIERKLQMFERLFPSANSVVVFSQSNQLKHLKNLSGYQIVNEKNLTDIVKKIDFCQFDYVMIHYLSFIKIDFVHYIPDNISIIWSIYGGDLYNQFSDIIGLKLYYKSPSNYRRSKLVKYIPSSIQELFLYLRIRDKNLFKSVRKRKLKYILNRLDVLSGMSCDIQIIENYAGRKYKFLRGGSYPLEQTLGDLYNSHFSDGKNIMLGNSASITNNHLYALEYMKGFKLPNDSRITLTLSYGRNEKYVKEVKDSFKYYFGNNLEIEESYIPINEYNKKFLLYRVMIMPAWRQESVGTLIMGFYFGIKVYMSVNNPLYKTMKDYGFIVFKLESITEEDLYTELTEEEKKYNRQLSEKMSSLEALEQGVLDFFNHG